MSSTSLDDSTPAPSQSAHLQAEIRALQGEVNTLK